jgi:hypothetical protein
MRVRTRQSPKLGARKSKIFDVSRYLEPGFSYRARVNGRTVKIPKVAYVQMLSPAGNLVNVQIGTDPNNRDPHAQEHRRALEQRIGDGFIPAWECPIATHVLDPDDQRELFGDEAPCMDHDFGWKPGDKFSPPVLCKHLEKIQATQRESAAKSTAEWKEKIANASDGKQIRSLLAQVVDQTKVRTRK